MERKNTFIIGHYGGDNFGDEFMLDALLGYLETTQATGKIYIVNKKPEVVSDRVTFVSPGFPSILKVFSKTGMLVLGGGTHFHDDYHQKRLNRHYVYLTKILIISMLYRISFKKVYFIGVGYAPLKGSMIKILTRCSLWLAHRITVRDKISYENLKALSPRIVQRKVKLAFDLASLHAEVGRERAKNETIVGISLTSFSFSSNTNQDRLWEDDIIPQIGAVYRDSKLFVRIFVFRGGTRESDIPLSEKLRDHLFEIDSTRVSLHGYTDELPKFVAPMAECEYFIATRYHSAVIAYLVGCKLLIIPYHQKLIDIGEMIDLDPYAVLDLQ